MTVSAGEARQNPAYRPALQALPAPMRRAFTLLELLFVVAIIGMLAALLFPAFARAREMGRRTSCVSQLHQLGLSATMYRDDFNELPPLLSAISQPYVADPRVFICPDDPDTGHRAGNGYMEGDAYLPSGESYEYFPNWQKAQDNGWWKPAPRYGKGRWDDLTPLLGCPWHWAKHWDVNLPSNVAGSTGWELILTAGGSVRKIRVEAPTEIFTPASYG